MGKDGKHLNGVVFYSNMHILNKINVMLMLTAFWISAHPCLPAQQYYDGQHVVYHLERQGRKQNRKRN